MNKELFEIVELRAKLLKWANEYSELAKQSESEYYSAKASAFCSAIIELDQIIIKWMKEGEN